MSFAVGTAFQRRFAGLVASAAAVAAALALFPGTAAAAPGDVGYQGMAFSGTGTAVTGSKPESKVWWNDDSWWAVLWDTSLGDNYIFRLNPITQTWANTGVIVDNRSGTRSDVLWDGSKLYVASHAFTNTPQETTSGARLYRFSYDVANDTYTRDTGFPVTINGWKTETLVIAKDSAGRLWATWNQGTTVYVSQSGVGGTNWGTPFALPVSGAEGITTDDISSVVAFGGNKIGVMWSDQNRWEMGFAVHVDGTAATSWTKETAISGSLNADDHINLKADSNGRVFAAVKTEQTSPTAPLIYLLVRDPDGTWRPHVFGQKSDHHTRPIVVLDEANGVVHMFATSGESGGTIYEKTAEVDSISFEPGIGTPVVRDGDSADVNDVTATKQNVTPDTGLVVLASNDTTKYYWHNTISLSGLPLAGDFTGAPTSGPAPLDVAFTDTSTGEPTAWEWDFGDGSTSTEQNPVHTYSAPGTYSVTLTVRDAAGGVSTKTRTDYVTAEPLAADFTGSPLDGAAPLEVAFSDTSTGSPTAWAWDFGDGSTSTEQNPVHTYSAPGTYSVTLTVTGANGETSTKTRSGYITARELTADFTGSPTSGPAPLAVSFTDTSIGTPVSWSWDFGDGGTSTEQNPTHTYSSAGKYTVSLTIADADGVTRTKTRTEYVDVLPLTADFTATPTFGAAPLTVAFTDTSIGTPTVWAWDFGDGGLSTEQNPTHTYAEPGTYTVTLTVADATGATSTKTRTDYVTASPDAIVPAAADSYVNSSYPDRNFGSATSVRVRNGNSSPPHWISYLKYEVAGLGDTVTAAKIRLHVTDAAIDGGAIYPVDNGWTESGLTWSNAPVISGDPIATIPSAPAGTAVDVELPKSVFAAGDGTYSFAIRSDNPSGGAAWYSSREGVAASQLVLRLTPLPLAADFTASPTSGGAPLTVGFTDTSDGEPVAWAWDFGDGSTSTEQNPSHVYASPGSYTVSLTVVDANAGISTETKTEFVVVEPLAANFTVSPTSGAAPLAVAFTDTSTGQPTAWAWDFGDGATSTEQNPSHTYTAAGKYTVTLTVTDVHGATSTKTMTDAVEALPLTADFTAEPTFGTAPLAVTFTDASIGTPTSWAWDFGDGTTSTEQNPSHTYANTGTYTVTLTVTDASGATSTKTRTDYVTASGAVVFGTVGDSYVDSSYPDRNFGTKGSLRVRNGNSAPPHYASYLKFEVSGLASAVSSAKLRLHVTDAAIDGGSLYVVDNGWTETGVTWNTAPVISGDPLANLGTVELGTTIEVDIPASVFAAGNGTYSFAIRSDNANGGVAWYSSREGVSPPQLIVQ